MSISSRLVGLGKGTVSVPTVLNRSSFRTEPKVGLVTDQLGPFSSCNDLPSRRECLTGKERKRGRGVETERSDREV